MENLYACLNRWNKKCKLNGADGKQKLSVSSRVGSCEGASGLKPGRAGTYRLGYGDSALSA
jgi:hypothetical protein